MTARSVRVIVVRWTFLALTSSHPGDSIVLLFVGEELRERSADHHGNASWISASSTYLKDSLLQYTSFPTAIKMHILAGGLILFAAAAAVTGSPEITEAAQRAEQDGLMLPQKHEQHQFYRSQAVGASRAGHGVNRLGVCVISFWHFCYCCSLSGIWEPL
jgi:hypothetical protein